MKWADTRALAVRSWLQRPWNLDHFLHLVNALGLFLGSALLWRRYGSRWWLKLQRRTARVNHDPVRRQASQLLRRAAKRPNFTWPAEVESALLRLRYGNPTTWPDPIRIFRTARRNLRKS
ncbi:MAG: hypothetical protein J6386_13105 [Candidatus Synoicihabitans palmerolidicus]|nr:hypothetical protein [Candidatus Synoicihabitans palmerolidicus]